MVSQTPDNRFDVSLELRRLTETLNRASWEQPAARALLSKHISEWQNLLDVGSGTAFVSRVGPMFSLLVMPVTAFLQLEVHAQHILGFLPLFHGRSSTFRRDAGRWAAVCTRTRAWIEECKRGRIQKQRQLAIQRYPMLVADEAAWGVASTYYPGPRWVSWKVELWWYFREHGAMGTGWERHRVLWLSHLDDLPRVWASTQKTAGLYTHVRLSLSLWDWDYFGQEWEEMDHV